MRVLVTGAGSLIGCNLVRHLLDSGFTVRVLLDDKDEPVALSGLPVEKYPGDILNEESVHNALQGTRAVFNCAPVTTVHPPRADWIRARNLDGTRNLLVSMSRAGVEDLVHVGSASSFGPGTPEEPGTEETPYAGEGFHLTSFDSMRMAQELVGLFSREGRVRGVIVNPTLVMGPYDEEGGPARTLISYVARRPRGYPPGGVNIAGARDVAACTVKALGRGRPGRCYILGNANTAYRELFGNLAAALDIPAPSSPLGGMRLAALGLSGTLRAKVSRKERVCTVEAARLAAADLYYSSARAEGELALERSPVEEILEEACRWFADYLR